MTEQKSKIETLSPAATMSQTNPSIDTSLTASPGGQAAAEVPIPKNFGRYKIEKELGKGAMGVVYLAEDSQIGRKVALKIPRKSAIEDAEALERFYREARTTGTLRHNNICPVYDVGAIDGVHYLTMAYIPGKPVSSFVNKEKLPPAKQIALLIRKIALALAEAHRNGVIHRDLKPSNVMLDDRGEPIVMDFGLARQMNNVENARLTQSGAILGTPAYMAPEQVRGEAAEIGPQSDIYALGVMMYQFLTGELPFSGPILMVFARILTDQPQKPSELRPDVDRTLEAICLKMMAKDAAQRYASMDAVAAALTEYLKTGTVAGLVIAPVAPVATASPPKKPAAGHTDEQLRDLVELVEQLLLRNDYLEAIRLVEEIPDYERTTDLRHVLGDAYETKSTVEKLERNLEKQLNQLDISELKKTVNALLKIHPSHPRGKEIKKALNSGSRKDVALLRKNATHFDAVGNVWDPKVIAAALGGIAALGLIVYFGVTIYLKNTKITVNDPNAVVTVDENKVSVSGADGANFVEITPDAKSDDGVAATDDWINLINGKDLTGWQQLNHPNETIGQAEIVPITDWSLTPEGTIKCLGRAHSMLRYHQQFGSFQLTCQFKLTPDGDSGLYLVCSETVGVPDQGGGFEVQLASRLAPAIVFGSQGSDQTAKVPFRPAGEWNDLTVRFEAGKSLSNTLNGQPVSTIDLTREQFSKTQQRGYIGLQDWMKLAKDCEFRNLRVRELVAAGTNSAASLSADGKDVWTPYVPSERELDNANGVIFEKGKFLNERGPDGAIILAEHTREDQAIRARVRIRSITGPSAPNIALRLRHGDHGSYIAWFRPGNHGIGKFSGADYRDLATGANQISPDDFVNLEFSAIGETLTIKLNGIVVLTFSDGLHRSGAPVISMHSCLGEVRNVELKSSTPVPWKTHVPSREELAAHPDMRYTDGVYQTVNMQDSEIVYTSVQSSDQMIRAKVRLSDPTGPESPNMGFHLRRSEKGMYACWYRAGEMGIARSDGRFVDLAIGNNNFKPDEFVLLTFSAVGNRLTLMINDVQVLTVQDDALSAGSPALETYRCRGEFRDVQLRIPPSGAPGQVQNPQQAVAPFNAGEAKAHQQAWAKHLGVPVEYTNSIGMKFVLIPPGEYLQGSTDAEFQEQMSRIESSNGTEAEKKHWSKWPKAAIPQHKTILTQPFYLGVHEVTQRQFREVTGENPSAFAKDGSSPPHAALVAGIDTSGHPVEAITWKQAVDFCDTMSQREGLTSFDSRASEPPSAEGSGYRLPTEAQWEFACRAGTTTRHWAGTEVDELLKSAWVGDNCNGRTHPVGELAPNPFGLYDMYGNVNEWTGGAEDHSYYQQFADRPAIDPRQRPSANHPLRPYRGGGWTTSGRNCSSAGRVLLPFTSKEFWIGFRVSVSVDAVKKLLAEKAKAPKTAVAPFNAEQAKAHQQAWAKHLGVPVEWENSIGMKFVLIPPGEFVMGSTAEQVQEALAHLDPNDTHWHGFVKSETPQHKVVLTQPFYLGAHEVTQAQYEKVMGSNPSYFAKSGRNKDLAERVAGIDTANFPVEAVTWNDNAEFCEKLSRLESFAPAYSRSKDEVTLLNGNGYRLPTEAEWEYACRAGTTTKYWSGDTEESLAQIGWHQATSGRRPHAVGELKPNPFGLFDMHGNAWERVQDWWAPNQYTQRAEQAADPQGSSSPSSERCVRGGSWNLHASTCRASDRHALQPMDFRIDVGMRAAISIDAVKQAVAKSAVLPRAVVPFSSEQAKAHQQAWAKHLGVPVEWENSIGMKFVLIPPGEFLMGAASDDTHALPDEVPQHQVRLSKPYYLGVYEVTQKEYERVTGANPSFFGKLENAGPNQDTTRWPVEQVGWNEAVDYCRRLTALADERQEGRTYRLPTEAEWEYACRAGTTTTFTFGNSLGSNQANFNGAYQIPRTSTGPWLRHPEVVGKYVPNAFGLYDTLGNVWEWCGDSKRTYDTQMQTDPRGPDNGPRLNRGGGWISSAGECRSSHRRPDNLRPEDRHRSTGLRVVCDVAPKVVVGRAAGETASAAQNGSGRNASPLTAFKNSLGMEFVLVPKGKSWLGGGANKPGDNEVEITDDFYLGKYEVTQGEWEQVMRTNPSSFKNLSAGRTAEDLKRFPVENVSWDDSQEFVKQVNQKVEEPGWTYRLPTNAEWEYACRNGPMSDSSQSAYHFYFTTPTNDLPPEQENFFTTPEKSLRRPCKVGSYQPNELGLYDMHGNISEWCQDELKAEDGATKRVRRGGEWVNASWSGHAGYRHPLAASSDMSHYVGLRLARVRDGKIAVAPSPAVAPFDAGEAQAH